jgi:hypothetical protein
MIAIQSRRAARLANATESGLLRRALALAQECGIAACDVHDVAARAMDRAIRRAACLRRGSLIDTMRAELARQLGVPRPSMPAGWRGIQAVGLYEKRRRECAGLPGRRWTEAFDRHSRHFAVENGVCPRCARPGRFEAEEGECECGFAYD